VDELIEISSSVRKLLDDSVEKAGLSRRERHKILRLSRTIADLQGDRDIGINHLTEAISYRQVIPWLRKPCSVTTESRVLKPDDHIFCGRLVQQGLERPVYV